MAVPQAPRTRVVETLDRQGIPYRLLPHGREVFTVEEAAGQRDVLMEEMVKSILLRDKKRRYVMACVRGDMRVDPKAVRAVLAEGFGRLQFASAAEIREITGSVKGAVAPVGLPERSPGGLRRGHRPLRARQPQQRRPGHGPGDEGERPARGQPRDHRRHRRAAGEVGRVRLPPQQRLIGKPRRARAWKCGRRKDR